MTIWQFSFWLPPYKAVIQHNEGIIPQSISENQFNDINWFAHYSPEDFLNSISYLPPEQHWNKDTLFFGDYDSNSIAISYKDHQTSKYLIPCIRNDYIYCINRI